MYGLLFSAHRRLLAAQRRRYIFLAAPLRLGPSAQIFCSFRTRAQGSVSSARRRLPLGGVQRRRGSPRLGGGVGGSPSRLSPVASRPRLRPPRTGRRPCVRTSLSPPASAVPWEPGQLPRVAGPWLRRCFRG